MNYPQSVYELIHWDIFRDHDSFGWFTVITGYEGTGRCFWCAKDLIGRRRFCKQGSGCWTRYQEHFNWGYAKAICIKRFDYKCANCGREGINIYEGEDITNLRVHHIIPLDGEKREISVYNIFWNLVCLCHDCHMELHEVMRGDKKLATKPDMFELALKRGQGILLDSMK